MDGFGIVITLSVIAFVGIIIYCSWIEIDKKRRKRDGLPKRHYPGLSNAEHVGTTITRHPDGKVTYSEHYAYPKDDD